VKRDVSVRGLRCQEELAKLRAEVEASRAATSLLCDRRSAVMHRYGAAPLADALVLLLVVAAHRSCDWHALLVLQVLPCKPRAGPAAPG
jgi:hypothetical protein